MEPDAEAGEELLGKRRPAPARVPLSPLSPPLLINFSPNNPNPASSPSPSASPSLLSLSLLLALAATLLLALAVLVSSSPSSCWGRLL